jgi:hypothetical protein
VKLFVQQRAQAHAKKVAGFARAADAALTLQLGLQDAFGRCQHVGFGGLAGEFVAAGKSSTGRTLAWNRLATIMGRAARLRQISMVTYLTPNGFRELGADQ